MGLKIVGIVLVLLLLLLVNMVLGAEVSFLVGKIAGAKVAFIASCVLVTALALVLPIVFENKYYRKAVKQNPLAKRKTFHFVAAASVLLVAFCSLGFYFQKGRPLTQQAGWFVAPMSPGAAQSVNEFMVPVAKLFGNETGPAASKKVPIEDTLAVASQKLPLSDAGVGGANSVNIKTGLGIQSSVKIKSSVNMESEINVAGQKVTAVTVNGQQQVIPSTPTTSTNEPTVAGAMGSGDSPLTDGPSINNSQKNSEDTVPVKILGPDSHSGVGPQAVFKNQSGKVVIISVVSQPPESGMLRDYLDAIPRRERPKFLRGFGSGFVADESGLIVTNYHVIDGAKSAQVQLKDGRVVNKVAILATAPEHDLALLKIAEQDPALKAVALGEGEIAPGQQSIAIGNPLGLEYTITSGIIGSLRQEGETQYLQMETTVAPGSSGGPLFNDHGEVIGVNVATRSAGLNLAIHVQHVAELLARERQTNFLLPFKETIDVKAVSATGAKLKFVDRLTLRSIFSQSTMTLESCLESVKENASVSLLVKKRGVSIIEQTAIKKRHAICISRSVERLAFIMLMKLGDIEKLEFMEVIFTGFYNTQTGNNDGDLSVKLYLKEKPEEKNSPKKTKEKSLNISKSLNEM